MEEEVKTTNVSTDSISQSEMVDATLDAVKQRDDALSKLRDALEANKKLQNEIINGGYESSTEEKETPVDVDALRKDLFTKDLSNLDYCTKALQLRDALINQGENDPFLPIGEKIQPTEDDIRCANKVAEGLKKMIEDSEGSPEAFDALYQSRVVDPVLPKKKKN